MAFVHRNLRAQLAANLAVLSVIGLLAAFFATLQATLICPRASTLILDRRDNYLGEVPASDDNLGYWPLPVRIPHKILQATLQTEDRFFYRHDGVHLPSVARALVQNIEAGHTVSGASTIAMQVARMQRPAPRDLPHKVREAAEALLLIERHGHDRVLRHYLTIAPYGNRVHGVARAARYYFDKPVEDLSWLQAAFLAGLPQAPGDLDPHDPRGLWRAQKRAALILGILRERGIIDDVAHRQAIESDLRLVDPPRRRPEAMHAVLRWQKLARQRHPSRRGTILHATIDLATQQKLALILERNLRRWRYRGAGNTAGLVVDTRTGEVLAYLGSSDYFDQKNRGAIDYATTRRPPGSALKPFVYALALERGLATAATELPDIQVEFPDHRGRAYVPRNITHTFLGPMLLREALANSRNIPALRMLAAVGVEPALRFFQGAGVAGVSHQPDRYGLGLALGNLNVTLEELVGLYAVLANHGTTLPFRFFVDQPARRGRRLLSPGTAGLVAHILSDPVARTPSFRRGCALEYDYAVAVKTGTSQGYRDAWAVAFSDRLLVGVWVGNHDWRRMNHLGGLAGAAGAVHRVMDALMPQQRPHESVLAKFPAPAGYITRAICPLSGKLAGPACPHSRVEYFKPGTEPVEGCRWHKNIPIDSRNGLLAQGNCPEEFTEQRVLLDLPSRYAYWARQMHLELAPREPSPLCGVIMPPPEPSVEIAAPRDQARYLWDPNTPAEYATIRLAARVQPRSEQVVWIVDGVPVARVGYPHEYRWSLQPGRHTIRAALANRPNRSRPVTVVVAD